MQSKPKIFQLAVDNDGLTGHLERDQLTVARWRGLEALKCVEPRCPSADCCACGYCRRHCRCERDGG